MVFGTCKLSEMALTTANSVVPEGPADGEQGQESEDNILRVTECQGKMQFKSLFFLQYRHM